jgi:cytochrome c oxidase cbb3-type subunit IV
MLKYIKGYAETIKNVQIYPIFSLLVFFLFFVAVLYYVKKMSKKQVSELSDLPLHDSVETDTLFNSIKS